MDQKIIDLFDRFTHGGMNRRSFFNRLVALTGSTAAASALLPLLQNNYARAKTVPPSDSSIMAGPVTFQAGAQQLSGYQAWPVIGDKFPAALVVHENRGLNPHIEDIARRLAFEGFLALALDFLSPLGGTPADEDKAREMIGTLKEGDVTAAAQAAVAYLRNHPASNGKVGAVGFCWGGGVVNRLAVAEPSLDAGVAYYGMQPPAADVPRIKAPLLLHYAGLDERINGGIPAYEAALKAAGKTYTLYMYEGVNHAFNNDTGSRYDKGAADLAWSRTLGFLQQTLAS
ncbi:MAG TPA: dienelactone hydrolase family protein [Alphaproteobacteria bacterium]|nr:dienelactone hydrolase family protein [Alphaproteobacteria bacterium]